MAVMPMIAVVNVMSVMPLGDILGACHAKGG